LITCGIMKLKEGRFRNIKSDIGGEGDKEAEGE
jgi:hypothetical protein